MHIYTVCARTERIANRIMQQAERRLEHERKEEREREATLAAYQARLDREEEKVGGARIWSREPRGAMFVVAQLISHL